MICLATTADADAISEIYAPVVRETAISFELEPPTVGEIVRRIEATRRLELPWLVHERDGRLLGYAYAAPHRSRGAYRWSVETSVFVRPSAHRTGAGRALYDSLLAVLELLGYRMALAGIALPNPASVGLHEALGFGPVGVYRSVGHKHGQWYDVGWWARPLGARDAPPQPPITIAAASKLPAWADALDPRNQVGPGR